MKMIKHLHLFFFAALTSAFIASCTPETVDPANNSNNNNNNSSSLYDFKTLGGTTWVLTAYHDTMSTTNMTPNDTLVFVDSTHYFYNGVPCTYAYYFYDNSMQTHLELHNTPFGDLRGAVPDNFELYGQINGCQFGSLTGYYYMWFQRQ